jgi:tetratricopeptide (TPR) repeat protein
MRHNFKAILCLTFLCTFFTVASQVKAQPDADYYVQSAVRKHKRHDIIGALQDYDRAIELEPDSSQIFFDRGLARNEINSYEAAIEDFDRALELDPENDSAMFNRGIAKYELKRFDEALKDFNRTIAMVPGDAKAYYNRAITKYAMNNLNGALRDATEARNLFKSLRKRVEYQEVSDFINMVRDAQRQTEY